jgi:hypothetical protein
LIIAMNLWILNTQYPLRQITEKKKTLEHQNETHIHKRDHKNNKNKADNTKQKRKCFLTSCAGHYEQAPLWLNSLLCHHQTQGIWNSPGEEGFGQS